MGAQLMRVIVDVKAGSREEGIEDLGDGHYFIKVKEPRKKGKANAAVIRLIQSYFDRRAMIVSGHTSSRKVVEIEDR